MGLLSICTPYQSSLQADGVRGGTGYGVEGLQIRFVSCRKFTYSNLPGEIVHGTEYSVPYSALRRPFTRGVEELLSLTKVDEPNENERLEHR